MVEEFEAFNRAFQRAVHDNSGVYFVLGMLAVGASHACLELQPRHLLWGMKVFPTHPLMHAVCTPRHAAWWQQAVRLD